jgi:hypothetical protein
MKLELKHLVAYLDHELFIKHSSDNPDDRRFKLFSITLEGNGQIEYQGNNKDYLSFDLNDTNPNIYPILHPLSDLTKEITVNGKTFIPSVELGMRTKDVLLIKAWGDSAKNLILEDANKLYSWHFDLAGLIEAGLAIDINTLKK